VIYDEDSDFGDILECPHRSKDKTKNSDRIREHVQKNCDHLTKDERNDLMKVLLKHEAVFNDKPGISKLGQHVIRLKEGSTVPRHKLYPIPISLQDEVERQVMELEQDGLISRSWSPYAHPVVCVKKANGEIRLAIDYRTLNEITVDDRYPMPNIDEFLMELGQAKYISSLDASSGYYQIAMEESSKEMTAFVTKSGLWQFNRMSFGLKNGGSTYQRTMNEMLADMRRFARTYIDDVAISSMSWKSHLEHIDQVLERFYKSGFTLKLKKCNFAQKNLKFLGHRVGSGTHSVDADKVEAIQDIPYPNTKKKVQSFLGLAGYYQNYIKDYATKALPLTALTKKEIKDPIIMNEEQKRAVDTLKKCLQEAPVLQVPNGQHPFTIECDASLMNLMQV